MRERRQLGRIPFILLLAAAVGAFIYWRAQQPNLPVESASFTVLANGDALLAGGDHGRSFPDNNPKTTDGAWLYDPAQSSWSRTASMPSPRENHVAVLLKSGNALVAGGVDSYGSATGLRSSVLYDPRTRRWSATGSMHVGRQVRPDIGIAFQAAVLGNGRVLIVGGVPGPLPQAGTAELYDPATGRWALTAGIRCGDASRFEVPALLAMPDSGALAFCDAYSSRIIPLTYDAAEGRWHAGRAASIGLHGFTATLLRDGTVLLAGGNSDRFGNSPNAGSWLYDSGRSRWSTAGRMLIPRRNPAAVRLADGRVLVAGGFHREAGHGSGVTESATADCEIYNPASHRWTSTGSLPGAAGYVSLTLLHGGSVLAMSGTLSSPEVYDPATQTWSSAG